MLENSRDKIRAAITGLAFLFLTPDLSVAQTAYFKGKTITIIHGRAPGGTGDSRVKALIPALQRHIPGNPTIVNEYMDGGGGRKAANHMFNNARPDGLTIGSISEAFVLNAILGETGVQYDVDKFIYLGAGNSQTNYLFHTRSELGLNSQQKLRAASGIRVGGQTVGHTVYIIGRIFSWLLELKEPKFVTGYSGPELDVAIVNGEIDARASVADDIPRRRADWIDKNLMHWHAVFEIPHGLRFAHPAFAKVPSIDSFAKTDMGKKIVTMARNSRMVGTPYVLPPATPREIAELLKDAFRKSYKDPEFLVNMKKLTGAEASPLMPEEQSAAISETPRSAEVIEVYKKLAGAGSLPPLH